MEVNQAASPHDPPRRNHNPVRLLSHKRPRSPRSGQERGSSQSNLSHDPNIAARIAQSGPSPPVPGVRARPGENLSEWTSRTTLTGDPDIHRYFEQLSGDESPPRIPPSELDELDRDLEEWGREAASWDGFPAIGPPLASVAAPEQVVPLAYSVINPASNAAPVSVITAPWMPYPDLFSL